MTPLLPQLIAHGLQLELIEPIDQLLADHCLRQLPKELSKRDEERVRLLLIHLSIATRSGLLYLSKETATLQLQPKVGELWHPVDQQAFHWLKRWHGELQEQLEQGWQLLLSLPSLPASLRLIDEQRLYWRRWWQAEQRLSQQLAERLLHQVALPIDTARAERLFEEWKSELLLLPEQLAAVRSASQQTLTLISGGPGTGKTHTAAFIVELLWQALAIEQGKPLRIALVAPTGKAAAALSHRIASQIRRRQDGVAPPIHSSTLHSLLSLQLERHSQLPPCLPYDLLLVDESSMVDLLSMERLFRAVAPHARLVLLGDHHQLPAVEPGAPFRQLIDQLATTQRAAICLRRSLRTDKSAILELAEAVKQGDTRRVLQQLNSPSSDGTLAWRYADGLPEPPDETSLDELADRFYAVSLLPQEQQLTPLRLLTPHRRGCWGAEALNEAIRGRLIARWQGPAPFVAPILIGVNDYQLELYNGEMGLLFLHQPQLGLQPEDYCLFVKTDQSQRQLPASLLPRYEWGWCFSVHKSQGSEFHQVIVAIPEGSARFGRPFLYTAITRARLQLELWGGKEQLAATLAS